MLLVPTEVQILVLNGTRFGIQQMDLNFRACCSPMSLHLIPISTGSKGENFLGLEAVLMSMIALAERNRMALIVSAPGLCGEKMRRERV
jgi:hypothetical protein